MLSVFQNSLRDAILNITDAINLQEPPETRRGEILADSVNDIL